MGGVPLPVMISSSMLTYSMFYFSSVSELKFMVECALINTNEVKMTYAFVFKFINLVPHLQHVKDEEISIEEI